MKSYYVVVANKTGFSKKPQGYYTGVTFHKNKSYGAIYRTEAAARAVAENVDVEGTGYVVAVYEDTPARASNPKPPAKRTARKKK